MLFLNRLAPDFKKIVKDLYLDPHILLPVFSNWRWKEDVNILDFYSFEENQDDQST